MCFLKKMYCLFCVKNFVIRVFDKKSIFYRISFISKKMNTFKRLNICLYFKKYTSAVFKNLLVQI